MDGVQISILPEPETNVRTTKNPAIKSFPPKRYVHVALYRFLNILHIINLLMMYMLEAIGEISQ